MSQKSSSDQIPVALTKVSGTLLSLILLAAPFSVLAHGGHGDEFQAGGETNAPSSVQVDAQTAKGLGIKVEPVNRQRLAVGIKTTGQIETLPNKQAEVTAPIPGIVTELLVKPGDYVKANQPVAILAAPELVELGVASQEKKAEGLADLQQAQADLRLAQQNYQRYLQITAAEIAEAKSQQAFAQERYDKDRVLATQGALPRRQALESQTQLAQAKAELTKASSRREVIEAQAQVKRAQSAVEVANSRIRLSGTAYQTRLSQLGNRANAKGLVIVSSPISGRIADREVSLGQSFEDAGGKLMTVVNDSQVFATANIYEKDLNLVKAGQEVSVKIASLPNRTFNGKITVIGSVVEGQTRVVPVKAELNNSGGLLLPGMFAQLEVLTNQTSKDILVIPSSSIVEANGKQLVYIQNGNGYQTTEVSLGQTSGDLVEVKSGLFEGDLLVTQRAPQLYAQSLRGGNESQKDKVAAKEASPQVTANNSSREVWLLGAIGGATLGTAAFMAGTFWAGRRKSKAIPTSVESAYLAEDPHSFTKTIEPISIPDSHLGVVPGDELSSMNNHVKSPEAQVSNRK
ncbi:efflux RND transporter periplasmic adaptor subunit [Chlorogloea sp. CCALA 695]|uniref:efflux RND transporter periplasmic adaptor subunit n=1 Tax=Chlorogloea sp. CCALA 695 TaxID=2107693 RepID=UPI000D07DB5F|nr:efflux RND transporter periplasmic adaptor subunit [Chlorogloea sp. CCALA 695]PSB30475.1 efflux RND transporter periplasmic adaptor subunit [Chlorogloea sp. CCALA 695]